MRHSLLMLALTLLTSVFSAQEKKPWQIDRFCGKLEHVQKISDRKDANTFSEKKEALRAIPLRLYERRDDQVCCEGLNAVETTTTGRGGHFEFKTKKTGDFWLATNWSGKAYKLTVVFKPERNSTTLCSQQGIGLDDDGNADWWAIVTVD